jgi:hypothetical protein
LSINNAVRLNSRFDDLFNFGLGGTVEASTKFCQKANNLGVRVTLDRYILLVKIYISTRLEHTIKRLDSWQILLPSHVLPIDLAEISYEESIFVAGLAGFMIDVLESLLQSISY